MKLTKSQLKQIIKEEISAIVEVDIAKEFEDARKYRTKGEWRIHASGTGKYLKPGWREGEGIRVEDILGNQKEARVFDNKLEADVHKGRIEEDETTDYDGKLEVVGAPDEGESAEGEDVQGKSRSISRSTHDSLNPVRELYREYQEKGTTEQQASVEADFIHLFEVMVNETWRVERGDPRVLKFHDEAPEENNP